MYCYEDVFLHQNFICFNSDYDDVELKKGVYKTFKDYLPISQAQVAKNPNIQY